MFNCITCENVYACKDDLLKHSKTHDTSSILCDICFNIFTCQDNLSTHIRNVHKTTYDTHRCQNSTRMGGTLLPIAHSTCIRWAPRIATPNVQQAIQPLTVAATRDVHPTTPSRAPAFVHAPGISTATVYGESPSLMQQRQRYSENSVENIKIQKDRKQSVNTAGFIEIDSSLQRTTVWYFRKNVDNITSHRDFLHSIKRELVEKLLECVYVHPIKYDLKLEATYVLPVEVDNFSENPAFNSPARQLFVHSNVVGLVDCDLILLLAKEEIYASKFSGFASSCIGGLLLGVHQYNPPISSWSYLPSPKSILNRRAVVNPQNNDEQCFKWAILAKHVSQCRSLVGKNYLKEEHRYDFSVLSIPTTVSEIKLFELANPGTSVNVYGVKNNQKCLTKLVVYPLRVTDEEMPNHFDLLLITGSGNKSHYTYISNFSRLVSSQINNGYYRRLIFCKKCFKSFTLQPCKRKLYGEEALAQHRLAGECVFNPNTALLLRSRRS